MLKSNVLLSDFSTEKHCLLSDFSAEKYCFAEEEMGMPKCLKIIPLESALGYNDVQISC